MPDLDALFAPRGIAVIDASRSGAKLGAAMARSVQGFDGAVTLVNSRSADPAAGLFSSVTEATQETGVTVDLAVLCVPARACAQAVTDAAAAGVRAALVCAGGFAETGPDGATHQRALLDAATDAGVRLLGPNTSGFVVPRRRLTASFVPAAAEVPAGPVGIVAASGGVNHALAFLCADAGLGVSVAVGLGNAVDISTADVVDHLAQDPDTRVIALHVESVSDGRRLVESVRRASARKPVVAFVVGRHDVAAFAASHTGALATSYRTTRAALAQAGAVLVDDEHQLVAAVGALAYRRLAPAARPGAAIVTAQAGPGLILLDSLRGQGVAVPPLAAQTATELASLLPPMTYQENPVDTGRPSPTFQAVLETVASDPAIDLVAAYALTEPDSIDLAEAVAKAQASTDTVFATGIGGPRSDIELTTRRLADEGVASFASPTALATGVGALVTDARARHAAALNSHALNSDVGRAADTQPPGPSAPGTAWDEAQAKNLLHGLGIEIEEHRVCTTDEEAHAALDALGGPVAMKLLDATVLHKTEVGGVALGIRTHHQATAALRSLRTAGAQQVLVERMAPDGIDLIVGARRDPVFGPVVLLGLGGTVAEALQDVTLRLAPLTAPEAAAMVDDLVAHELLDGFRGGPTVDRAQLAHVLTTLGDLLAANPHLTAVEINPLRATGHALVALDAVLTTKES